jgi:HD-GYP domain-containing protein (c-di-GMP phosphodiesterase class II)
VPNSIVNPRFLDGDLRGNNDHCLALSRMSFREWPVLRKPARVDAPSLALNSMLRNSSIISGLIASVSARIGGVLVSRSFATPPLELSHLRAGERTDVLPNLASTRTSVAAIDHSGESSNGAAPIRQGSEILHRAYVEFIEALASALDARDPYTAGHSRRVSNLSCLIAQAMRFSPSELDVIRVAARLHDIGKIGIADAVLQKPGKLTQEEFASVRQHPSIGRRILEPVQGFQPYLDVVELHHENWDGSGYPSALCGEATPLNARIVHVADAYDAITSDRPYRRGMSGEAGLRILVENAGTQFDPAAVATFVDIMISAPRDNGLSARPSDAGTEVSEQTG